MNKSYEYTTAEGINTLNELGKQGWRFVHSYGTGVHLLEREIKKIKDYSTASLYHNLEVPTGEPPF